MMRSHFLSIVKLNGTEYTKNVWISTCFSTNTCSATKSRLLLFKKHDLYYDYVINHYLRKILKSTLKLRAIAVFDSN